MPIPALSLVGFMDEQHAIQYLQNVCLVSDRRDEILHNAWITAQRKLGAPMADAGHPEVLDVPVGHEAYLEGVQQNPRFSDTILQSRIGDVTQTFLWEFKLVQIDPLLAYQFDVQNERAERICAAIAHQFGPKGTKGARSKPPVQDMLRVCLPHTLESTEAQASLQPNGFLIRSLNRNLRMHAAGPLGADQQRMLDMVGVAFGPSSPLVQVMKVGDRYYLRNGFHRAYGLRKAGATHVPCILLHGDNFAQIGAPVGGSFSQAVLESANPPTCGHFTQGRAYPVKLRQVSRVIAVSWAEYTHPEE